VFEGHLALVGHLGLAAPHVLLGHAPTPSPWVCPSHGSRGSGGPGSTLRSCARGPRRPLGARYAGEGWPECRFSMLSLSLSSVLTDESRLSTSLSLS
jgi:hypothetical protein